MNSADERPDLPPRSHSLNTPDTGVTVTAPLAVALDFEADINEEIEYSNEMVAEAAAELRNVEDGWNPKRLFSVVEGLVERIQHLVRCSRKDVKSTA